VGFVLFLAKKKSGDGAWMEKLLSRKDRKKEQSHAEAQPLSLCSPPKEWGTGGAQRSRERKENHSLAKSHPPRFELNDEKFRG
jgi:hypothetical protein